jgi:hypothetical protein
MQTKYLIWSNRKGMWWKANSQGYTTWRKDAGGYAMADAVEICTRGYDITISNIVTPDNVMIQSEALFFPCKHAH